MENFNWKKFKKGEIIVHCETEKQAEDFLNEAFKREIYFINTNGEHYDGKYNIETCWEYYEKHTCYLYKTQTKEIKCDDLIWLLRENKNDIYEIEWSNYIKENEINQYGTNLNFISCDNLMPIEKYNEKEKYNESCNVRVIIKNSTNEYTDYEIGIDCTINGKWLDGDSTLRRTTIAWKFGDDLYRRNN